MKRINHRIGTILFFLLITSQLSAQSLEERINSLLSKMSLQEKIDQLHKDGGMNTPDNGRLKIPGFIMADGPHGVRDGNATSFPVGIGMAATWDVDLARRVGKALGEEFRGKGKHQMLGPAVDLTRDPRNGRTPESGGEDPYLNALMNASVIQGVQSTPCLATIKHFNCKHKQKNRTTNNYILTQRLLMEHYGLNFRLGVQDGGAFSLMSAYNLINGEQASESSNLLRTILHTNWGFPFYVVSDWGAIKSTYRAISGGCNVCMGSDNYQNDLLLLVNTGTVPVSVIDDAVKNVLRTKILSGMMDYYPQGNPADVNSTAHQTLCLEAGKKGLVLLKNDSILPLNKDTLTNVAIIGPNADVMQTDGTGSSWVTPFYSISPRKGLENYLGANKVFYAKGCDIATGFASDVADALQKASKTQLVIFVGGLDASQEGEELDRVNGSIELPGKQKDMINQLTTVNKNVIVVIVSGGICGVNAYINNVRAMLHAFYPGQEGGNAIAQVLFGDYNPSGKLPVTLPKSDAQLGTEITDFDFTNDYGCGYRWFDKKAYTPDFAFGFGLSYTTFQYSNLQVSPENAPLGTMVTVSFNLTNTGSRAGEEVAQCYVSKPASSVDRPVKELKAFTKVSLAPGETKQVSMALSANELYYYDETAAAYKVEPGLYTIAIGGSSDNLPLQGSFTQNSADIKPDLQIANVYTIPRYPLPGDKVQFAATVVNRGTGASPAGKIHRVEFKVNGAVISASTEWSTAIPAGGMALVNGAQAISGDSYTWPAAQPGEFTVTATVNPAGDIDELYNTNNTKTITAKVYPLPPTNLALNKPVKVSSVEKTGVEGMYVNDGSYSSRWSSAFSDPQYVIIDLGTPTKFNQVNLYWEAAYATDYAIQVSNDSTNWTTLVHQSAGVGGIERYTVSAEARFLKILGSKRATAYGYSLYEIEVFQLDPSKIKSDGSLLQGKDFQMEQNYPNPFNSSTVISYYLPREADVQIVIMNALGQIIRTFEAGARDAGAHRLYWDGKDSHNLSVASGVYFYRLLSPGITLTNKMLLLR
jgi:beta-glucosidase